jgi:uncharacterized protein (DUF362 family)
MEGLALSSKVAVVELGGDNRSSLKRAFDLIGGIADLNVVERPVVVKVGVFDQKAENHASISLVDAIIHRFDKAPKIFVVESDNYRGTGSERLQIWKELYTQRVIPFNLSNDVETRRTRIAGQQMRLSHLLFKPSVLVDTHILRSFESGSILKNLFGCILDSKRMKYHKVLPTLLADVYEAMGGVDLAVLDGTYLWLGAGDAPIQMKTAIVGRDAVAVETVGATLAGLNPRKMPVIQEFVKRGLGEGSLENIEVVGASFESLRRNFLSAAKAQKKPRAGGSGPQTWGGQANRAFRGLVREGFFKQSGGRTIEDVVKALEARGLSVEDKQGKIVGFLTRRVKKGILKSKDLDGRVCWTE